jgi:hypothetical protein
MKTTKTTIDSYRLATALIKAMHGVKTNLASKPALTTNDRRKLEDLKKLEKLLNK